MDKKDDQAKVPSKSKSASKKQKQRLNYQKQSSRQGLNVEEVISKIKQLREERLSEAESENTDPLAPLNLSKQAETLAGPSGVFPISPQASGSGLPPVETKHYNSPSDVSIITSSGSSSTYHPDAKEEKKSSSKKAKDFLIKTIFRKQGSSSKQKQDPEGEPKLSSIRTVGYEYFGSLGVQSDVEDSSKPGSSGVVSKEASVSSDKEK